MKIVPSKSEKMVRGLLKVELPWLSVEIEGLAAKIELTVLVEIFEGDIVNNLISNKGVWK